MSINGIIEFALHIDSFRNLDLIHQGLYRFELSLTAPNKSEAIPIEIKTRNECTSGERVDSRETHLIQTSYIHNASYFSRTFFIKYCDEEVKVNDVV